MPAAVHPSASRRAASRIAGIDYFQAALFTRVCDLGARREFIGLDSLEQTQDLLVFISACCGIENPSLGINDFLEVSGFLDCEMF
jgi:hypothetical protein